MSYLQDRHVHYLELRLDSQAEADVWINAMRKVATVVVLRNQRGDGLIDRWFWELFVLVDYDEVDEDELLLDVLESLVSRFKEYHYISGDHRHNLP